MLVFDPAKDAANIAKHGVSLAYGDGLDLTTAIIVPDNRSDYGEPRLNAYGYIDGVLFALTFTVRGDNIRAISLRRARDKELRKWTKKFVGIRSN